MPSRGPTKGSLEIILVGIPEMYYDTLKAGLFSQNIHVLRGRGHAFCKSGYPIWWYFRLWIIQWYAFLSAFSGALNPRNLLWVLSCPKCKGINPRQSRILDSTLEIPDSRYWIHLDSGFWSLAGFWIPGAASQIPRSISRFQNQDQQTWGIAKLIEISPVVSCLWHHV